MILAMILPSPCRPVGTTRPPSHPICRESSRTCLSTSGRIQRVLAVEKQVRVTCLNLSKLNLQTIPRSFQVLSLGHGAVIAAFTQQRAVRWSNLLSRPAPTTTTGSGSRGLGHTLKNSKPDLPKFLVCWILAFAIILRERSLS